MTESFYVTFNIEGMTCSHCTGSVHTALTSNSNVSSAVVSLADNNAVVTLNVAASPSVLASVMGSVEEVGFDVTYVEPAPSVSAETVSFQIEGMTCSHCTGSVHTALTSNSNVSSAVVSLADNNAVVTLNVAASPSVLASVMGSVEEVGFDVTYVEPIAAEVSGGDAGGSTVHLRVEGMVCQNSCASAVQQALVEMPLVAEAAVSCAEKQATVVLRGPVSAQAVQSLVTAIHEVGFVGSCPTYAGNDSTILALPATAAYSHSNSHEVDAAGNNMLLQSLQSGVEISPDIIWNLKYSPPTNMPPGSVDRAYVVAQLQRVLDPITINTTTTTTITSARPMLDDAGIIAKYSYTATNQLFVWLNSDGGGACGVDPDARAETIRHILATNRFVTDDSDLLVADTGEKPSGPNTATDAPVPQSSSCRSRYSVLELQVTGSCNHDIYYIDKFILPNLVRQCNEADAAGPAAGANNNNNSRLSSPQREKRPLVILSAKWISLIDTMEITFNHELTTVNALSDQVSKLLKVYNDHPDRAKATASAGGPSVLRVVNGKTRPIANRTTVDENSSGVGSGSRGSTSSAATASGMTATAVTDTSTDEDEVPAITSYYFEVSGMSCANCASKIEKNLLSSKKLLGVNYATVSCITNTANVMVDNRVQNVSGVRDIQAFIESLGYNAKFTPNTLGSDPGSNTADVDSWAHTLRIALLFGIPVILLHASMLSSKAVMAVMMDTTSDFLICSNDRISLGQVLMLLLNTPLQVLVGQRFYRGAFLAAYHSNSYGMDCLVVTGTTIIYLYSAISLLYVCFESDKQTVAAQVFFEAAGMLLTFVTIGKYIEAYSKSKAANAIAELVKFQPKKAVLLVPSEETTDRKVYTNTNEKLREIEIDLVQINDVLKVLPGCSIPADGVIVHPNGEGDECFGADAEQRQNGSRPGFYVDNSMITGESEPVLKHVNDPVYGSTINTNCLLYIRVTAVGANSTLANIIRVVQQAQLQKAPIQAFADQVANVFAPAVLALAAVTFITWLLLCLVFKTVPPAYYEGDYGGPVLFSLLFAISVVVISCPCALGLATPMALIVGSNVAASRCGLLIKGGSIFETAHRATTVCFDKTGTLTVGKPVITDIKALCPQLTGVKVAALESFIRSSAGALQSEERDNSPSASSSNPMILSPLGLLYYAASAEQGSEHPIATTIIKEATKKHGLELAAVGTCQFYNSDNIQKQSGGISVGAGVGAGAGVAQSGAISYMSYYQACVGKALGESVSRSHSQSHRGTSASGNGNGPTGRGISCIMAPDDFTTPGAPSVVLVGNEEWLRFHGVVAPWLAKPPAGGDSKSDAASIEAKEIYELEYVQGKSVIYVAINGHFAGYVAITDPIRPEAFRTIDLLQNRLGLDVWIMTGDHRATVACVASQLGVSPSRCVSHMTPAGKLNKLKEIQMGEGQVVVMVGDGVNDSPALTQADVGIAVGAGTSIAIEAADVVLVRNNLLDILTCIDLARAVFSRIKWNLLFACAYNAVMIPYAAGLFFSYTRVMLAPQYAGLLMALSSISVVLSSLALYLYKKPISDEEALEITSVESNLRDRERRAAKEHKRERTNNIGIPRWFRSAKSAAMRWMDGVFNGSSAAPTYSSLGRSSDRISSSSRSRSGVYELVGSETDTDADTDRDDDVGGGAVDCGYLDGDYDVEMTGMGPSSPSPSSSSSPSSTCATSTTGSATGGLGLNRGQLSEDGGDFMTVVKSTIL